MQSAWGSSLPFVQLHVSSGVFLLLQLKLGRQLGNCLSCRYTSSQVDGLTGVSGALVAHTVLVWQSSGMICLLAVSGALSQTVAV